jgi:hypothetical protein
MPITVNSAILLISIFQFHVISAHEQFAAVKGQLMCGALPAESVTVRLYDKDVEPDIDDLLDFSLTDVNGEFNLKGSTFELTNIEPILRIYTNCNDNRVKSSVSFKGI